MNLEQTLVCYTTILAQVFALPHQTPYFKPRDDGVVSLPSPLCQDSFYSAPPGFESRAPGIVLRIRAAPGNLTSIFNGSSAAYNILYSTTNSRYQPSWAVTTLFVPSSPSHTQPYLETTSPDTNWTPHSYTSLLSYQIPYKTADPCASPSFLLSTSLSSGLVRTDITFALSYGWYVSVPDFEGPTASFTSGVQEGHAVLDSIRAVLATNFTDLNAHATRYVMWGYSGGSIASEWAAELAVQYAPEMNFAGVALGGLVPNVTSLYRSVDGSVGAGLIPTSLIGISNQYPEAYEYLLSRLKPNSPYNVTGFLATKNLSVVDLFDYYAGQSMFPITLSTCPIHDEYSPINDTDKLVARYCEVGADVRYERNTIGNHVDEETNGDARALDWLRDVLNGSYAGNVTSSGYSIVDVAVNVTLHGTYAPP